MIILLLLHSAAGGHYSPVSGSSGLSSYPCSRTVKKLSDGNHILHHTTSLPEHCCKCWWEHGKRGDRRVCDVFIKTRASRSHDHCLSCLQPKGQQEGRPLSIGGHHHFCRCAGTPRHFCCCFCLSYKVRRLLYGKITVTLNNGWKNWEKSTCHFCSCVSSRGKYDCSFIA